MQFSKELLKGSTSMLVLGLLQEREMYGYEIVKVVNERTGGRFEWKEGTLYPCLHKLESCGMLKSRWHLAEDTGKKRKYYHITRKGMKEFDRCSGEWREFQTAVNAVLFGTPA